MSGLERFIFLVVPIGHEDKAGVVLGKDDKHAIEKASKHPAIEEILKKSDLRFAVRNLTEQFEKEGYNVSVTLKGIYH